MANSTPLTYTPADEIPEIYQTLRTTFYRTRLTLPLSWRTHQLLQLARLAQDHADAICEAIALDLGKPRTEVMLHEIGPVVERAVRSAERVGVWARPEEARMVGDGEQRRWRPRLLKAPKGVVLVISAWNYPMILTMQPLIGAIAAGCCAIVKPSEHAPHFAQLISTLLPKYLDSSAFRIVNGGIPEATKLLELHWDHIFYIGNNGVAKVVAGAAARYLTPLTLELGGKNPVLVDPAYDMDLAAKRILWGKCCNAGQTCVAPDYILVNWTKQDDLVEALKRAYETFFPHGALDDHENYGNIVNEMHFDRLCSLLDRTKGEIVMEGRRDASRRRIEPTIVKNVADGDSLLDEEIFGPILPIIPVDRVEDSVEFVNARPRPLVLYAFTEDPIAERLLVDQTQSGSLVFNDTFQQLAVEELPLAGVGESGYGTQVMKYTFDAFTHTRSCIDVPKESEPALQLRYPPYNEDTIEAISSSVYITIPPSSPNGKPPYTKSRANEPSMMDVSW
ncbi:aldehyde dehydrogenase [Phlebopus sp. FC_14]|nr:aldehyde dehydrogenase [Phlebopus sp. FC_14]